MTAFITEQRTHYGIEPICEVLQIAPSTYYAALSRPPSARALRDEKLKEEICRIYETNCAVYGAKKVWRQLNREDVCVARCTVERLMRKLGLRGVVRGKTHKTTTSEAGAPRPADLVERDFAAQPALTWPT